jgi:chromate transporter
VNHPPPTHDSLPALFLRFLRFGLLAWGGPVAQIAMVRRELVDEERWITSERFNRLLAVYQVLPGPEAHEMCVHMGMLRRGRIGGLLAGLGFMLPGFVLILALSWLYFRVDLRQAAIGAAFLGIQIAVIALIVRAVHRIAEHILVDRVQWAIGIGAALATFVGVSFWLVLIVAGFASAAAVTHGGRRRVLVLAAVTTAVAAALIPGVVASPLGPAAAIVVATAAPSEPSVVDLLASGLKAGLLTFGGAYTAIPFVRRDAVGAGWLTDGQFLDGLALSGILPAPFIIFSTFVGYVAGGLPGAVAMTVGVFLPAFAFSLVLRDRIEKLVENEAVHSFLSGVAAGVVGIIAVTTLQLAAGLAERLPSIALGAAVFVPALLTLYLWRSKANIPVVIAAAAIAGWVGFGLMI